MKNYITLTLDHRNISLEHKFSRHDANKFSYLICEEYKPFCTPNEFEEFMQYKIPLIKAGKEINDWASAHSILAHSLFSHFSDIRMEKH